MDACLHLPHYIARVCSTRLFENALTGESFLNVSIVSESGAPIGYHPVVLVACGSFNPPTIAHLRMMELARDALTARGYDVMGGYLSPVSDAYWKQALAPGAERVALARAAAADSDFIMVDAWEATQPRYTRTLVVLQRVATELARLFEAPEAGAASGVMDPRRPGTLQRPRLPAEAAPAPAPRSVLVCGADVLESMADPQLWQQDLLERLLAEHGVVCISRGAVETAQLLERPGTLLNANRANITIVQEPVPNEISSSLIRQELANGRSVKYLVPEAALALIYDRGLYGCAGPVARAGTALHTGR